MAAMFQQICLDLLRSKARGNAFTQEASLPSNPIACRKLLKNLHKPCDALLLHGIGLALQNCMEFAERSPNQAHKRAPERGGMTPLTTTAT
jgi:hypothetical protein